MWGVRACEVQAMRDLGQLIGVGLRLGLDIGLDLGVGEGGDCSGAGYVVV